MTKYVIEKGIVPGSWDVSFGTGWEKKGILRTKTTVIFPDGRTVENKFFCPIAEVMRSMRFCRKDCTYIVEEIYEEA